LMLVA